MRFQDLPIKRKLVALTLLICCSVLVVAAAIMLFYEFRSYRRDMSAKLSAMAEIVAANSSAVLQFDDPKLAREILLSFRAEREIAAAALYDREGRLYARFPTNIPASDFPAMLSSDEGPLFHPDHFTVVAPVYQNESRVGTLFLKANYSQMYQRLAVYGLMLMTVLVVAGVLAALLTNVFESRISRPLLQLADVAKVISEKKDFSVRAKSVSRDELGYLTEAFNSMLAQIQSSHSALRDSEERFREMINALPAAVYTTDAEGFITHYNPAAIALAGREPKLKKDRWCICQRLFHGDGSPMTLEDCPMALALKERRSIRNVEIIAERPDGGRVWIAPYPTPFFDAEGRLVGGINMVVDITEQKLAEESIRASEARERARAAELRAIMEAVPAVIWIARDRDASVINGNRISYELLRLPADSNASMTAPADSGPAHFRVFCDSRELRPEELPVQRAARGEEVINLEEEVRFDDGSSIFLLGNATPMHDAHGEVCGAVAAFVDITKRKQAEEALREREGRYELVMAGTEAAIWDWDILNKRVLYSPRWKEMRGLAPEEISDSQDEWLQGIHPADLQRVRTALQAHFDGQTPVFAEEYRVRHKDGHWIWILDRGLARRDASGRVVRMAGSETDITERKRAEETLLVRTRQQEAVARLGELALRERDVQKVFDQSMALLSEKLGVQFAKILEVLEDGKSLLLRAGVGWKAGLVGRTIIDSGLDSQAGYTLQADGPVLVTDLQNETRFTASPLFLEQGITSGISCIIPGENNAPWGVLGVHDRRRISFTQDDLNFLIAVANILGDVIHRERAEKALRDSETKYRTIFEGAAVSLWEEDFSEVKKAIENLKSEGVTDFPRYFKEHPDSVQTIRERMRVLDVNDSTMKMFEARDKAELLGGLPNIFTEESLPIFIQELLAVAQGERFMQGEARLHTLRGNPVNVLFTMTLPPPTEKLDRVIFSLLDISERKQAEKSRVRLASIVQSSGDAIISKTLEGIIRTWNPGAERLFGYTAEEAVGQPITLLFPPDRIQEEQLIISRVASGESIENFETIRICKDGRLVEVSLSVSPLRDAEGRISGVSKIARDITERKRAQRELERARDAAEAANRAKDDFLAALSHELRTPLMPVMITISMLQQDRSLPSNLRDSLAVVRRNIEIQSRMINDLLDLSRIRANKLELALEVVDLHDVLSQAMEVCRGHKKYPDLKFVIQLDARSPFVRGDADRLQQVFWNLIQNAMKFTPPGGQITISTHNRGDRIAVAVADTGCGIEPELLARMFQPFEQGGRKSTETLQGLGLGLAIARQIAVAHGGELTATSEGADRGSTFTFELDSVSAPPNHQRDYPFQPELVSHKS